MYSFVTSICAIKDTKTTSKPVLLYVLPWIALRTSQFVPLHYSFSHTQVHTISCNCAWLIPLPFFISSSLYFTVRLFVISSSNWIFFFPLNLQSFRSTEPGCSLCLVSCPRFLYFFLRSSPLQETLWFFRHWWLSYVYCWTIIINKSSFIILCVLTQSVGVEERRMWPSIYECCSMDRSSLISGKQTDMFSVGSLERLWEYYLGNQIPC